jgi:hypothetical protein
MRCAGLHLPHPSEKQSEEVEFVFEDQVRTLMVKRFNSSADPGRLFGIQVEEMEMNRRPLG